MGYLVARHTNTKKFRDAIQGNMADEGSMSISIQFFMRNKVLMTSFVFLTLWRVCFYYHYYSTQL